jgi:hypothetical protein
MNPDEIERRRALVQADALRLTGDETIEILASTDGEGEVVVAATVADRSRRPWVLQIIRRQFRDASVKFEP